MGGHAPDRTGRALDGSARSYEGELGRTNSPREEGRYVAMSPVFQGTSTEENKEEKPSFKTALFTAYMTLFKPRASRVAWGFNWRLVTPREAILHTGYSSGVQVDPLLYIHSGTQEPTIPAAVPAAVPAAPGSSRWIHALHYLVLPCLVNTHDRTRTD